MTFLLYHLSSCKILPTGGHEMQTKMQQEEEISCTLSVLLAVLVNVNPSLVLILSIGSCFQFPVFSQSPTSSLLGPSIDSSSIKSCSFLRLESQTLGAPISSSRNSQHHPLQRSGLWLCRVPRFKPGSSSYLFPVPLLQWQELLSAVTVCVLSQCFLSVFSFPVVNSL